MDSTHWLWSDSKWHHRVAMCLWVNQRPPFSRPVKCKQRWWRWIWVVLGVCILTFWNIWFKCKYEQLLVVSKPIRLSDLRQAYNKIFLSENGVDNFFFMMFAIYQKTNSTHFPGVTSGTLMEAINLAVQLVNMNFVQQGDPQVSQFFQFSQIGLVENEA